VAEVLARVGLAGAARAAEDADPTLEIVGQHGGRDAGPMTTELAGPLGIRQRDSPRGSLRALRRATGDPIRELRAGLGVSSFAGSDFSGAGRRR
jgi:hypothetical protein